jgi:hypothetical protein
MKRKGPRAELQALRRFIGEAEAKFLRPHLPTSTLGTPSREELLDVAAFVVLAHGALENFIEGVGLWALESLESSWVMRRRTSRCVTSLLLYQSVPSDHSNQVLSVFDNLRLAIADAKSAASRQIEQNNGIGMRQLRTLFRPLGIDVPEDPQLTGSFELLISMRHQWAHQYRYGATVVKFASDVKKTTDDCLALAQKLANQARLARP